MSTENASDAAGVGQAGTVNDFVQKYDATHGKYVDTAAAGTPEGRLPTVSFPKAPDPSPFSIGPMTSGERE
jgi:hypothetical protein